MKKIFSIAFIFICGFSNGQSVFNQEPKGGSGLSPYETSCISEQQYNYMIARLKENERTLKSNGKWSQYSTPLTNVLFEFPIKKSNTLRDKGFFAISGYFDHNPASPGALLDYNCGTRSSDNAINHRGTDYALWPFQWQKMLNNEVEVVAAAAGTIIYKFDGNFDECGCVWTNCNNWNAIYIRHSDNTIAFYGHLKKNSLTLKSVGDSVSVGEYLGIVGSSGQSSGPHLHFEVWKDESYTQLIDPYAGPCNSINGDTSKWVNQENYRVSTLCLLKTHSDYPQLGTCPASEIINEKTEFLNGERVVVGSYYRDQLPGQVVTHSIVKPDGSLLGSWQQVFTDTYNASYWLYDIYLPNPAPYGIWKYKVNYNGEQDSTLFAVNVLFKYRFTGSGNYSLAANWQSNRVPPNPVPNGVEVIIDNQNNECVIDIPIQFATGSKLIVSSLSKLRIPQNLVIQ